MGLLFKCGIIHADNNMMLKRKNGFTLIEIMIAVGIIGLLAAIALPSLRKSRNNAQNAKFINDLRVAKDAVELYATLTGRYPTNEPPGIMPNVLSEYLPRFNWSLPTSIGGN